MRDAHSIVRSCLWRAVILAMPAGQDSPAVLQLGALLCGCCSLQVWFG